MELSPDRAIRRSRSTGASLRAALVACTLGQVGCVSRSTMERCHQTSRALQGEVAQLRDLEARQRSENRDLVERAVADGERLRGLETVVARQDRMILAYQDDREQLAAQLERVVRVARGGGTPIATLRDRMGTFVVSHPGTRFDADSLLCEIPLTRLVAPETSRLTEAGERWLEDLAGLLEGLDPEGWSIDLALSGGEMAGDDDAVRRASLAGDESARVPIEAIRDRLAKATLRSKESIRWTENGPEDDGPSRLIFRLVAGESRASDP